MVRLMESDRENVGDLTFLFASETTNVNFTSGRYEAFIRDLGVYGEGMWKTECIDHKRAKYGALTYDDAWVLPSESVTFDCDCPEPEVTLRSWSEYYRHRKLSLNSPAAILMTYPMTLYHVVTSMYGVEDKESLTVHVVGAEKEADLIPAFRELQYLLPSLRLNVVLIGPRLSRRACSKSHTFHNVSVSLKRGVYHALWSEMEERPDLVVGFNAGLAAYSSWMDTIKLLTNEHLAAYFTDYCVESCEYSRQQLAKHPELNASMTGEVLNPFRSPIRICDRDSVEPRFSNNYIYSLEKG